MKTKWTLLFFFLLSLHYINAQSAINLDQIQLTEDKNIQVKPLHTDEHSSGYLIVVRDSVRKHYHNKHTESIYILEGKGQMLINKEKVNVAAGDYLLIPPQTIHAVWVTSTSPLKVLSTQAPQFFGKDRIFIED